MNFIEAATAYRARFDRDVPIPACIPDETVLRVVLEHLERGEAIEDEYDWYKDLPPGAVA
ncbi:hypothetical protein R0137_09760 [Congregibacter brevis]|uniref:Uncharacterized protein n=1 Tax=Congregibacter brevis TaxID=3081201 RepID=A0ABZ0I8Q9_9GAMM|nr:hypothetical protein R0137_09760 [Congregibacter sp. IMCC45268]